MNINRHTAIDPKIIYFVSFDNFLDEKSLSISPKVKLSWIALFSSSISYKIF